MINKKQSRIRRSGRTRGRIKTRDVYRLCVHRTPNHVYAQLISPCGLKTLASASTLEKVVKEKIKHGGNKKAAAVVGDLIAKRAKEAGITEVAFDRSGYKYHGRIQVLADAAREAGLKF